jgi:hypothetical protein
VDRDLEEAIAARQPSLPARDRWGELAYSVLSGVIVICLLLMLSGLWTLGKIKR